MTGGRGLTSDLQLRATRAAVHACVGGGLAGDGVAFAPPQDGGRRVGHHLTADVHGVALPRVEDGVVVLELRGVCWWTVKDLEVGLSTNWCCWHCLQSYT